MTSDEKARRKQIVQTMEDALRAAILTMRPEADVSSKFMFGGAGFYAEGQMIAAWFGGGLAIKLPEDARAELLAIDGAAATQSAQYIEVPPAFMEQPELFAPWVERSIAYAKAGKRKSS